MKTLYEQRMKERLENTDKEKAYCPICGTLFFKKFTSDGAMGWAYFSRHVGWHTDPKVDPKHVWFEACPFCEVGFHVVPDFINHLQEEHGYTIEV